MSRRTRPCRFAVSGGRLYIANVFRKNNIFRKEVFMLQIREHGSQFCIAWLIGRPPYMYEFWCEGGWHPSSPSRVLFDSREEAAAFIESNPPGMYGRPPHFACDESHLSAA